MFQQKLRGWTPIPPHPGAHDLRAWGAPTARQLWYPPLEPGAETSLPITWSEEVGGGQGQLSEGGNRYGEK